MIDISAKFPTLRRASARAELAVQATTFARIASNDLPKQDPLIVARWAGIQAAKRTSELIPACHQVPLDWVEVHCTCVPDEHVIIVRATAVADYKTGVEMEALVAATIAALTLYDMLKPVDQSMYIRTVRLEEKHGGLHPSPSPTRRPAACVIVISDSVLAGSRADRTGPAARAALEAQGFSCGPPVVVGNNPPAIAGAVRSACDLGADLVITCGGTGLGPRDLTASALRSVLERETPGIAEWLRAYSRHRTPRAVLSNGIAGLRAGTLIIALPGSPRAVTECLTALAPVLPHALDMVRGEGHGEHNHD
ncbi:MAG: bifunctional molybdenum cofactor biosynthesis protein MoaC/MoaB [bacterium]|nr:bifunctional molybdenum cofactor biosynthesis protein MoaC/MoaB [bacterium]